MQQDTTIHNHVQKHFMSSRRVSSAAGGGGQLKTIGIKIVNGEPREAESREGSSAVAESSWVT